MARPTARVLLLLELLQGGGTHTVASLAERLEVDERTVRRYVEHLLDLDVPVRSVRGRHGGYRLAPGFRMPPLMLTEEEALATLLGLSVLGASGVAVPAGEAAAKVRRVLPAAYADRVGALLETLELTGSPAAAPAGTDALLLFAEAARARRPVAFAYRSGAGRESARTVAPYGLVAHRGRWFVTGADSESGEVRTFRLDRVALPRLLEGTFEVPDGPTPGERVVAGIAAAPRRWAVRVRFDDPPEAVAARLPAGLAVVRADGAGSVVELQAEALDWVPGVVAGVGSPFTVEAPDELRAELRAVAARLVAAAE